jgi:hypothetical protein
MTRQRSETNAAPDVFEEKERDAERLNEMRRSSWGVYWWLVRVLCCKPSPQVARPIDMLKVRAPYWANRLYNLQLSRQGGNREIWRNQLDGIAFCIQVSRRYKSQGACQKCVGDLFTLIIALAAVLTPLLIGLQGSIGSEVCTPGGSSVCVTKDTVDSYIKYIVIFLSIANSVVVSLRETYSFRTRGVARRAFADRMKYEIEDYLAL